MHDQTRGPIIAPLIKSMDGLQNLRPIATTVAQPGPAAQSTASTQGAQSTTTSTTTDTGSGQ